MDRKKIAALFTAMHQLRMIDHKSVEETIGRVSALQYLKSGRIKITPEIRNNLWELVYDLPTPHTGYQPYDDLALSLRILALEELE